MASELGAPLPLSTPDTHILNETSVATAVKPHKRLSDEELSIRYEIQKTANEIKQHKWKRVALQFPDEMLPNSARVFQLLARGLGQGLTSKPAAEQPQVTRRAPDHEMTKDIGGLGLDDTAEPVKLTILADTSYGSCCVDEIAAEHVEADVVIHYGRSCLSPTARLPVVHIFTKHHLSLLNVLTSFRDVFPDKSSKVIVMADVTYTEHVKDLCDTLTDEGWSNIFATSIMHDPSSPIPNRSIPESVQKDPESLKDWQLFHVSEPPTSLLLTLSSRVASVHIYPIDQAKVSRSTSSLTASTSMVLRRRYALITSLVTVSIWGILINTLSVKNYLHMVDHVRKSIAVAGKKSYLFVVGKLNAAKVANFSEIGGWVVIGCWESSLIDSKDFYKPVITPFELELALKRDEDRIWTGQWRGDFQGVLDDAAIAPEQGNATLNGHGIGETGDGDGSLDEEYDTEEESAPPEFDLRTGRYVSHSRPMQAQLSRVMTTQDHPQTQSKALMRKAKGDLATVNGVTSPAAEFLRSKRTWKGLGSDLEVAYEEDGREGSSAIEEGRTGIARGYTVADSGRT